MVPQKINPTRKKLIGNGILGYPHQMDVWNLKTDVAYPVGIIFFGNFFCLADFCVFLMELM
jgi:hypothetical protein